MKNDKMSNDKIADILGSVADLLEIQGATASRIRNYRQSSKTVRRLCKQLAKVIDKNGLESLAEIKGIGPNVAQSISEIVHTGCLRYLEQLKQEVDIDSAAAQSPEIVQNLRGRIYSGMGTEPLDDLNLAPHDLKLDETNALGGTRVHGETNTLSGMYNVSETEELECSDDISEEPSVKLLLAIDAEYRKQAAAGNLKTVSPKENNPENKKWLPVMDLDKEGWFFTASFSNTDVAHELDKIFDWVVINYQAGSIQGQCTVLTSSESTHVSRRIIRGREDECEACYNKKIRQKRQSLL